MIKYDKFDQRIIDELLNNSRIPLTKLSRKLHKNRENVLYRFNRLVRLGIIQSMNATINTKYFGYTQYALFLQLKQVDETIERKLISFLQESTINSWIGVVVGKWSLVADVYACSHKKLNSQIGLIMHTYKRFIQECTAMKLKEKVYTFAADRVSNHDATLQLDTLDYSLLHELNKDARISYASLSSKFRRTANTLKRRIKLLEKHNIIKGYSAVIDHQAIGLEVYGLQLKILSDVKRNVRKINECLLRYGNVVFVYEYTHGPWNLEIGIATRPPSEMRLFIRLLKHDLPNDVIISSYS